MVNFQIDERLLAESELIGQLELSTCLLVRDLDLPWFVLIPRIPNITEFYELTDSDQVKLNKEISKLSRILKDEFRVDKVNIGMIGNMVRQLHIHIIGRFKTDKQFPKPIWGFRDDVSAESEVFKERFLKAKSLII